MPYKAQGFGCHSSRIVFGTAASAPIFNEYVATEIDGGATGIALRHLHIDPILVELAINNPWQLLILKQKVPGDLTAFQRASNALLLVPGAVSAVGPEVLFSHTLPATRPSTVQGYYYLNWDWDDGAGPKVEPGQTMSIIVYPSMQSGSNVGINASALITFNAFGGAILPGDFGEMRGENGGPERLRSIPRGSF